MARGRPADGGATAAEARRQKRTRQSFALLDRPPRYEAGEGLAFKEG